MTTVIQVQNEDELIKALDGNPEDITLKLVLGTYILAPIAFVDSTCGNCEDPNTPVDITMGLLVSGKNIHIKGPSGGKAEIITNAGYGIFFLNCEDCSIANTSITGGQRDPDGNATDAAIVVKKSSVTIKDCVIHDNIGDSATVSNIVVGVMGIAGREESRTAIEGNQIIRNSWDGVALYRDAEADIKNNVIDGVDKARGAIVGGGRGVGIGVTWNARATIEGNLVTRYWKGIGLFVDADAIVRENIVEDVITWGIALWDADKGIPRGRIEWNAVYQTGACGVSITRSEESGISPGFLRQNAIMETAQNLRYDDPDYYCFQCALAIHAAPDNFEIADNWFTHNRRATEELPDYDVPEDEFRIGIKPLLQRLRPRSSLGKSKFLAAMAE